MKEYVVRLTDEERKICEATVGRLKGSSQKARRAVGSRFILRGISQIIPVAGGRNVSD